MTTTPERLVHFSAEPFAGMRYQRQPDCDDKPAGLWVSIGGEDGWWEFCHENKYALKTLRHEYEVTLTSEARILRLSSAPELDTFSEEWRPEPDWTDPIQRKYHHTLAKIDWSRVARYYQGIIIAPYIWERRLTRHTRWYYGFDFASGCIWDAAVVESIRLVAEHDVQRLASTLDNEASV
jgi:hypothetical protein